MGTAFVSNSNKNSLVYKNQVIPVETWTRQDRKKEGGDSKTVVGVKI